MKAMPVADRITAEQFLARPPVPDAALRELVDGEVIVNHPSLPHNYVQTDLLGALRDWTLAARGRGRVMFPLDVQLDERNVFMPDVLWYAEGRVPGRDARTPCPLPDLAAEVRSPSTWAYDVGAKKAAYERHGLRELWLVDTRADEVLVFRRSGAATPTFDLSVELTRADSLTSPQLPGFALALATLFGP